MHVLIYKCSYDTYAIYRMKQSSMETYSASSDAAYVKTLSSINGSVYQVKKQVQYYIPDMQLEKFCKNTLF